MAPNVPAEIDVFTIPHSRMKELVNIYTQKIQCIDFKDCQQVSILLKELKSPLHEFKSHESIENMFIMDQLKNRLKQRHIYNSAVCNCHNDNKLSEIMKLVKSGKHFWKSSIYERITFGKELQSRFIDFVQQFLPHMEEEETIFQPLLVEHFEYDELCVLKKIVLEQHELIRDPMFHEKAELDTPETDVAIKDFRDLDAENCFLGDLFATQLEDDKTLSIPEAASYDYCQYLQHEIRQSESSMQPSISLPAEILMMIFNYLEPPDRGRCAQVCSSWNQAVYSPALWKEIFPVQWAREIWSWKNCNVSNELEDEAALKIGYNSPASKYDEDADIDECEQFLDPICEKESALFTGLIEFVLPRVGIGVEKLILDAGKGINSRSLNEALSLCPNLTNISAAYSLFDYYAFKGLWQYNSLRKLKHIDLQGCELMDDNALNALAECIYAPMQCAAFCSRPSMFLCENPCLNTSTGARSKSKRNEINSGFLARSPGYYTTADGSPCPYDVRWMIQDNLTEIEELFSQSFQCRCYGTKDCKSFEEKPYLVSLNLSGCWRITDSGIASLLESGFLRNLQSLNVSGCFHLSGSFLTYLIQCCQSLIPESLTYCNNITNGPYATQANGCDTLCHPIKACCQSLVKY